LEADPLKGPSPSFALAAAALAGQLAFVVAPIGAHFDAVGPWVYWTAPVAPLLFAFGWIQRSATALLVGVPGGWFVVAYGLPELGYGGGAAIVLVTFAYVVAAVLWSSHDTATGEDGTRWEVEVDPSPGSPRAPIMPCVVGLLVAASGLSVALWPALQQRAIGAFPGLGERVAVGLGLVGTLAGLIVAASILRRRPPLSWRSARAMVLSVVFVSMLVIWWLFFSTLATWWVD